MKKSFLSVCLVVLLAIVGGMSLIGCDELQQATPVSSTGVQKATAEVHADASTGLTLEQTNVKKRLELENVPGKTMYLYILSAYSGQVIYQSTVKGKVTSSDKRLTPLSVSCTDGEYIHNNWQGFEVSFPDGDKRNTSEVLQDDGTYGSSIEYLYWWDVNGVYHQQYVSGGMMVHISDQPERFGRVTMQVEQSATAPATQK